MSSAASSHDLGLGELRLGHSLVSKLVTAVVISGQGLLFLLSAALFARWLSGALGQAAPAGVILTTAAALTAFAVCCRSCLARSFPQFVLNKDFGRTALFALPALTSLLVLASLMVPGVSAVALACAWAIVVAGEAISWFYLHRRESEASVAAPSVPAAAAAAAAVERSELTVEPEGDIFQELTRTRSADGSETLSATVRIDFPVGDRLQVVHLAFCPPLGRMPQLEVEQQDGAEVELRTTTVQTFGARIEARLTAASDEPQSAIVQIYAATELPA